MTRERADAAFRVDALPPDRGTYVVALGNRAAARITVGRFGRLRFPPGCYLYVGSAFGPGGLRARLGRHLRGSAIRRWHIDFLRPRMPPVAVWFRTGGTRCEHRWAHLLGEFGGAAVAGFGCSDCRCSAHLFHLADGAMLEALAASLADGDPAPAFVDLGLNLPA